MYPPIQLLLYLQALLTDSQSPKAGKELKAILIWEYVICNHLIIGLSYMSKVVSSLIETLLNDPERMTGITKILEELNFTSRIIIKFHSRISSNFISDILSVKSLENHFDELLQHRKPAFFSLNRSFFENEDGSISKQKVLHLKRTIKKIKNVTALSKSYSVVNIDRNGLYSRNLSKDYFNDLMFFIESGILKLNDIILEKVDGREFSINQASSGEQSCIVSMLGIASKIQDNSLICIDEPEICLHPEWQEKYIRSLTGTFKFFKRCHFLIATHSPQIVSNILPTNSFVLSMESGKLTTGKYVVDRSADFQLANLFNSPGFKNEFLIRVALNTFAKVSKGRSFDKEDEENYEILNSQKEFLDPNDPVLNLVNAIQDLHSMYA
jgi:hypothetical protein